MQPRESAIDEWLDRVRAEYLEMPGLRLTLAQAARFWSLNPGTCARVLDALVTARFLVVTTDGLYTRAGTLRKGESAFPRRYLTRVGSPGSMQTSMPRESRKHQSRRRRDPG
jgi:hypothetical protein